MHPNEKNFGMFLLKCLSLCKFENIFFLLNKLSHMKIFFQKDRVDFSGLENLLWKPQCPTFEDSDPSCLTRYQKALWGGLFLYTDPFNFTCHNVRFRNHHHISSYVPKYISDKKGQTPKRSFHFNNYRVVN